MADKREIEVFSAGCANCTEVIEAIRREAGFSAEVVVLNMFDSRVVARAKNLGIQCVPAVVIDGKLASCAGPKCVDIEVLKAAGLGKTL
jgi:predicted thioredoxin/glutaredoxin